MRITYEYIDVVKGGFEWVGIAVEIKGATATLSPGRIGRAEKPLIDNGVAGVTGGWEFTETRFQILPTDTSVDVILNKQEGKLYTLVRTGAPSEVYSSDIYEHLLTVMSKDTPDSPWRVFRPIYRVEF